MIPILSTLALATAATPMKIILDTDIAGDIDDAYALALLAVEPNVKLIGVTTAFGETGKRAQVAAKLLQVTGRRDVPVYAGSSNDRDHGKAGRQYEWAKGFRSRAIKPEPAVEFMHRAIDREPGEITLIAIGPLTNLGELFARYPDVRAKVKRIVIMGGSVRLGYNGQPPPVPEYNIQMDPVAARAVFESGVPLTMAGLEATAMLKFDADHQSRLYAHGTPLTDALAALTHLWGGGTPTQFDPMAVAFALGHRFCEMEKLRVVVGDDGMTRLAEGPPNVELLVNPRVDQFLDWMIDAVKPK